MKRPSKYVRILQNAREQITSKQNSLICCAIHDMNDDWNAKKQLRNWVHRQLKGTSTYEGWLRHNHRNIYYRMDRLERSGQDPFREGRLQWLDWMIANVDKELK